MLDQNVQKAREELASTSIEASHQMNFCGPGLGPAPWAPRRKAWFSQGHKIVLSPGNVRAELVQVDVATLSSCDRAGCGGLGGSVLPAQLSSLNPEV